MRSWLLVALGLGLPAGSLAEGAPAETPPAHLAQFGAGAGPSVRDGTCRLLDEARTPLQSNAVAFDRAQPGAFEEWRLDAKMRVLEGGDGGSFLFLDTREYGTRGPAPFLANWVEPNLRHTFAVGVDVHDPPSKETFTEWGNYQDQPQREVSLHWDGREVVKRVAPEEFRGKEVDLSIAVDHVVGGAEVTVRVAGATVFDRYFVAEMAPYECRLALGAGTRADATTSFDVSDLRFVERRPAAAHRAPIHVEVFNHVLTDNSKTAFTAEVALPPPTWAFGRVLLTLDIHDAGEAWDEWDRNGDVSVWTDDGTKVGIVPFITSYRTPCHWVVDVTPFRPLLGGRRRIEVAAGTTFYKNRGYMMSVSLDFYPGTPAEEPYRVVPLWTGVARHGNPENHFRDFFVPRTVPIDAQAVGARVFLTTTGHSQVGEFTPARRTFVFAPEKGGGAATEHRFLDVLWKTDCYLNPNRPQFGTWQFSRAGWAPGDVVRPWWIDLTPFLKPGREAELRYEPAEYDFSEEAEKPTEAQVREATHDVRAYLILYRKPDALVAAPTVRVEGVQDGSNAAKAGIAAGDYLVEYDGKPVSTPEELRAAIRAAKDGGKEKVTVVVYRGTERVVLTLDAGTMGVHLTPR